MAATDRNANQNGAIAPSGDAAHSRQRTFSGFGVSLAEKVRHGISLLKMWQAKAMRLDPELVYWGCDSGGKDSGCIRELASMAGVTVTWHFNVTGIDPPEIHRFIRHEHPDTIWERKARHFFRVFVEDRGYPLRHQRWCCQEFKEASGAGKVTITGVRWAESPRRRAMWKPFQRFDPTRSHGQSSETSFMVNPIIDWTTDDVWAFTRARGLPYCSLYDEGFARLGCVGCPMSGAKGVRRDFARWPQYERAWRRAFHRLWDRRGGQPLTRGKRKGKPWPGLAGIDSPDQLFEWWKSGLKAPSDGDDCQLGLW